MSAAATKFEDPGPKQPQWLGLAQAVFNNQAHRWDGDHCGGGLRWQFNSMNDGWMFKNSISKGVSFNWRLDWLDTRRMRRTQIGRTSPMTG